MAKRAILHMGMPKTGTTSFQNAIFAKRDILLRDHRMMYPSVGANHTNALCAMFLPDPRTHISVKIAGINTVEAAEELRQDYFRQVEADLVQPGWDTLVLSAEGLANLNRTSLSELHDWLKKWVDEIEVIYWIRHPVRFTVSVMQQMIKGGETIQGMLQDKLPLTNYHRRIENAMLAFGDNTIRLFRFEDAVKHSDGLVAAFCEQIGLPPETTQLITADATVENESMSMLAAHGLSMLNRLHPLFKNGKLNPLRPNGNIAQFMRLKGPRFDLDAASKQIIREKSRPEILWLKERFGCAFYPDILDPQPDETRLDGIPDDETAISVALQVSGLDKTPPEPN